MSFEIPQSRLLRVAEGRHLRQLFLGRFGKNEVAIIARLEHVGRNRDPFAVDADEATDFHDREADVARGCDDQVVDGADTRALLVLDVRADQLVGAIASRL